MKVVPQAFYRHPGIEKIMIDGLSSIIYKKVDQPDSQNQRYLSSHALTLVLNGELQIETYEGDLCRVRKNQIVFLPKGIYMISDIIPNEESFEAIVFFFDEDLADDFLSSFKEDEASIPPTNLTIKYGEDLRLYTDTLLTLFRGKQQFQFTRAKLLELLHLIALTPKGPSFIGNLRAINNKEKKSIKEFMEAHFDKPLDIEDYAYLTGRSVSTFQRDFKRRYSISPKKWLIGKRLEKASTLLRQTTNSVMLIMQEVGYENMSHFIKAFHKKYGLSPKQFQIRHRNEMKI